MSELKLRRLSEHNQRLREDLARPRMRVSEASARYVGLGWQCGSRTDCVFICQFDSVLQADEGLPCGFFFLAHRAEQANVLRMSSSGSFGVGSGWKGGGPLCSACTRVQLLDNVNASIPSYTRLTLLY